MEGDENALAIARRKLFSIVMHCAVRRPVRGKGGSRGKFVRAHPHCFAAVATVLWRKDKLLLHYVVVTLGPAVVTSGLQQHQFFCRLQGFAGGLVTIGPFRMNWVTTGRRSDITPGYP